MRFSRHENFITEEERLELLNWMKTSNKLVPGIVDDEERSRDNNRLTTRLSKVVIKYPDVAYNIQKRIMELHGFKSSDIERVANDSGMIAVRTLPGGSTFEHIDEQVGKRPAVRCNILLQESDEGGELYIEDKFFPIKEKELHCYSATKWKHRVGEVKGDKSRYIWLFGFEVENWDAE